MSTPTTRSGRQYNNLPATNLSPLRRKRRWHVRDSLSDELRTDAEQPLSKRLLAPVHDRVQLRTACGHSVIWSECASQHCGFVRAAIDHSDGSDAEITLPEWISPTVLDELSLNLDRSSGAEWAKLVKEMRMEQLLPLVRATSFLEADELCHIACQVICTSLNACSVEALVQLLPGLRDGLRAIHSIASASSPAERASTGTGAGGSSVDAAARLSAAECVIMGFPKPKMTRFSRRLSSAAESLPPPQLLNGGVGVEGIVTSAEQELLASSGCADALELFLLQARTYCLGEAGQSGGVVSAPTWWRAGSEDGLARRVGRGREGGSRGWVRGWGGLAWWDGVSGGQGPGG